MSFSSPVADITSKTFIHYYCYYDIFPFYADISILQANINDTPKVKLQKFKTASARLVESWHLDRHITTSVTHFS